MIAIFKYRKHLKEILSAYYKLAKDSNSVTSNWLDPKNFNFFDEDYIYLEAKQLIIIRRYTDDGFVFIPSPLGITYFENRRDKIVRFLIPTVLSIIAIVISVIALFL